MSKVSNGGRVPRRFRAYYWLMLHVYPHERLLYRFSRDYREWWGPR